MARLLDFVDGDRVEQFLSHNGVSVLDKDHLLINEDSNYGLAVFESFIVAVRHAISHEVTNERDELGCVLRAVLIDEQRHVHEGIVSKRLGPDLGSKELLNLLDVELVVKVRVSFCPYSFQVCLLPLLERTLIQLGVRHVDEYLNASYKKLHMI